MKVFISWSNERSKQTAICLKGWIRKVIQATEPWISDDIEKGRQWNDAIKVQLEESKVGIICMNKDNLNSPWLLFEAGALSKTNDAHVCTFLLDLIPADIIPPLSQFQHTRFEKEDIRKLVHTINNKIIQVGAKTIPEKELDEVFEVFYPELHNKLSTIENQKPSDTIVKRTDRDILEEILQTVRTSNMNQREENSAIYDNIYKHIKNSFYEKLKVAQDLNSIQKNIKEVREFKNRDLFDELNLKED